MLIDLNSFLLFLFFVTVTRIILFKDTKKDIDKNESSYENYPSGMELINELKCLNTVLYDKYKFDYYLIDAYTFREYVYKFEMVSGFSREVSLKMALDEYIAKNKPI